MKERFLSITFTLLLFFLLLFVYTKIAGPIPFYVNSVTTNKSTTFDVTGEGKATIKPDKARVLAGVSANGNTSEGVQQTMNTNINKVITAIKALGISENDIQTSQYSINPNYDFTSGTRRQNGFIADTTLTITVNDLSKLNAVIDAATSAGATNVSSQGFENADTSVAEEEARKLAIEDAKNKAEKIASVAGFKLGNIINYYENKNGSYPPLPMRDMAISNAAQSKTNLEPGTNEIILTVTLSYEVK